jgi:hypothetical protein
VTTTISTRNLAPLPDIDALRALTQSLALLDAILCPDDWESRYHSFNASWAPGEQLASMRDGCGDQWFALFSAAGVTLHGLAHEAPYYRQDDPWPQIFDAVPAPLRAFLDEPAFDAANASFCIWRRHGDTCWSVGPVQLPAGDDPDGSKELLALLDGRPESYRCWAEDYFECELRVEPVAAIYAHTPLDAALCEQLNPEVKLADVTEDAEEIGYPLQSDA